MATTKELIEVANAASQGITDLAVAINALEASVTAALNKLPEVPQDVQDDIDAAVGTLRAAAQQAAEAVLDAADGVDEAKLVPPEVPEP